MKPFGLPSFGFSPLFRDPFESFVNRNPFGFGMGGSDSFENDIKKQMQKMSQDMSAMTDRMRQMETKA
jgi:hypothetical protein